MERFLERLNPLSHVSGANYADHWKALFATVLQGFWGRLLASTLLILSFWFGVRRRNFAMASLFFVLAVMATFASPILRFLGLL